MCYSTDMGFAIDVRSVIQVRKSKDLVEWTFIGQVFNNLPAEVSAFIARQSGTPFNSLWAPYNENENEYRLYYGCRTYQRLRCNTWTYTVPFLQLNCSLGTTDKVIVQKVPGLGK